MIQPVGKTKRPSLYGPFLLLWMLAFIGYLFAAHLFVDYRAQWYLAGALLIILFILKLFRGSDTARTVLLCLAVFIVMRYLFWRTTQTLEFYDWLSFTFAIILYLAEVYGIMIFMLGVFVNIRPFVRKPVPLPPDEQLPTVDVLIPSYNEGEEILEVTIMSCLQMNYPREKLRIYLLDDGGTEQKCNQGDDASRRAALIRRENLFKLCSRLGIQYLTREKNVHAKAGNINDALRKTNGDLVVVFDADHVPTENFLEKTVGLFNQDPKLFLVQTPHFFVNPDPIEKNLNTFYTAPSENEMFYRVVQQGLDYWNASFFCGSGALLRRSCLEENGGMAGETITEDAETALNLHAKGYNSAYISEPLLSGLAPETMGGFISQRIRWATGMVQIFILKCPLLIRGLTLPQRLAYTNSCAFWFFPFARLVFLIAPVAFLVFGLKIYAANLQTFTAYAVPHLITVMTVSSYLYGRYRRPFVSELYELIQSVYCIPAIIKTVFRPRAPAFKVTPKGEFLNRTFVSPLAFPFYILTAINLVALIAGIRRYFAYSEQQTATVITICFAVFNLILLLAALGALLERRQRRSTPRIPSNIDAQLEIPGRVIDCRVADLSLGGCQILLKTSEESHLKDVNSGVLHIRAPHRKVDFRFNVEMRILRFDPDADMLSLGVQFNHVSEEEQHAKVRFIRGSSDRWMEFQRNRESRLGVVASLLVLLGIGLRSSAAHILFLPLQKNSWVDSGSGRPPIVWYNAVSSALKVLNP